MENRHPHADASYEIIQQSDGSFGVKVSIPDTSPTTVTGFATRDSAIAWASKHKEGVGRGVPLKQSRFVGRKPHG
jgi:hypothetical protein